MSSGTVRAVGHAPRVDGKFLDVENRRFLVKGVAYGTFAPDGEGNQFPPPARVTQDFELMASAGINTVRSSISGMLPPQFPDRFARKSRTRRT